MKQKTTNTKTRRKAAGNTATRPYLRADERRASIIEAAQKVFSKTTLQGARIRDLASAAGVNQATLYEHFASKEELFMAAVVEPLLDTMRNDEETAANLLRAESGEAFLEIATRSALHTIESMVNIYPLLVSALFSDYSQGAKLYREHIVPLTEKRAQTLSEALPDDLDARTISLFALGMFIVIAMDRHFTGDRRDLAEIADQMTRFSAFGFAKESLRD